MIPIEYNFPIAYKGDTYPDIPIRIVNKNGAVITPIDLTGCQINMQVKNKEVIVKSYSTSDSSIVITNASNGQFKIAQHLLTIGAGAYRYDLQVIFPDSVVRTYMKGLFQVANDITRL